MAAGFLSSEQVDERLVFEMDYRNVVDRHFHMDDGAFATTGLETVDFVGFDHDDGARGRGC